MRMRAVLLSAVFAAGVLVGFLPAKTESAPPILSANQKALVEKFVAYFDTIVFGAEYDRKQAATIVYKWRGPIRIYLQYAGVKEDLKHKIFLKKHMYQLRRLTGLPVLMVGKPAVANIKIVFVKRDRMGKLKLPQVTPQQLAKLAAPGGCYFIAYKSGPGKKQEGRIHSSIIVVNAERDISGINHCLLEEMTQSIGFPNDSNNLRPSVFSDKDRLFEFSPVDKVLLRVLYDKRMKMGMTRAQGLAVARKIMTEIFFGAGDHASARAPNG